MQIHHEDSKQVMQISSIALEYTKLNVHNKLVMGREYFHYGCRVVLKRGQFHQTIWGRDFTYIFNK